MITALTPSNDTYTIVCETVGLNLIMKICWLYQEKFPPNIYYKIFTHRPVQDMCANSPKDYTAANAKRRLDRDVHNKGNRVPKRTRLSALFRLNVHVLVC